MLGCIGHIVNLAAKAGLKVLGHIVPSEPSLTLIDDEVKNVKTCFIHIFIHFLIKNRLMMRPERFLFQSWVRGNAISQRVNLDSEFAPANTIFFTSRNAS